MCPTIEDLNRYHGVFFLSTSSLMGHGFPQGWDFEAPIEGMEAQVSVRMGEVGGEGDQKRTSLV